MLGIPHIWDPWHQLQKRISGIPKGCWDSQWGFPRDVGTPKWDSQEMLGLPSGIPKRCWDSQVGFPRDVGTPNWDSQGMLGPPFVIKNQHIHLPNFMN